MKNIENNRISAELTDEQVAMVLGLIGQITDVMDFLIGLTNGERMSLPKINKANKLFTEDAIAATELEGDVLPTYIKPEEAKKDFNLYMALDPILLAMETLYYKVRDTQMLAGSEAYTTGLMIHRMYKIAAEAGIPGAQAIYNSLRERFQQAQRAEQDEPSNTEETTD